mgnify:CR=1 FL=1
MKGTERGGDGAGILRINFPGSPADESLDDIGWDTFFQKFEEARLAMEAGLAYVHAPVDCSRLEPAHYELLRGVLRTFEGRRVLVHCAGNVKSSALVALCVKARPH